MQLTGIDIQYLDGIDIQYLDGIDCYGRPMTAEQIAAMRRINQQAKEEATARRHAIQALTYGVNNDIAYKAEQVANGGDFCGFCGDGSVEDEEMIRRYLVNTKEVADAAPIMVSGYQNAQNLSSMIGYVLKHWDSSAREQAIDNMIAEEQRLQGLGAINDVDGARNEFSQDSYSDVDVYMYGLGSAKNSFFKSVKRSLKPTLTTEAQDIVAANPATYKLRNTMRKAARDARKAHGRATSENTSTAVNGVDDDAQMLLSGEDMQYAISGENPLLSIGRYMQRTRRLAVNHPEYFESPEQANKTIDCVDALLSVWNNKALRNRVFAQIDELDGDLGKLFKKIGKAIKKATTKAASAVKTAARKTGQAVKKAAQKTGQAVKTAAKAVAKAAKKVGKAIAKVAKKVWKFIVRFNPLTLLIRAGILGFVRLNMFKVANKCYIGSLSKQEALKLGASTAEWEKSNKAYEHLRNAYTKLGGKENKLKSCLQKGNKKKWEGTEYPTDGNAIKAAANKVSAADNKEAQADMDYDETMKEYNAKGYVSDSTVSTDKATEEKKVEVTIIENERTAKNATKLLETDEANGKLLVNIAKGAKVVVDTAQKSGNYIAASYNGKDGWVLTNDLAGLGDCDAESCAVLMAGAVYDMGFDGLGEPATATAVASASSVIASIMAKIKNIFGVAQKVAQGVSKAKEVIDKGKEYIDKGKQVVNAAKTAAAVAKNPKAAIQKAATKAADKITNGAASNIKHTATAIKSNVTAAKNVVNTAKTIAKNPQVAVKTAAAKTINKATSAAASIKNVANTVQNKTNAVKSAVNTAKNSVNTTVKNATSAVKNQTNAVKSAINTAQSKVSQAKTAVNDAKSNINTIKNVASSTPNVAKTAVSTVNKNVAKAAVQSAKPTQTQPATKATPQPQITKASTAKATTTKASPTKTTTTQTSKGRTQMSTSNKKVAAKQTTQQTKAQPTAKLTTANKTIQQSVQQAQQTQEQYASMIRQPQPQQEQPQQQSGIGKTALIIGGLALAAGGAFLLLRRKK